MSDTTATESLAGGTASIYVPYPATAATSTTAAIPAGYSFLRLGQPDTGHENGLPNDPSTPGTAGDGTVQYPVGAMLYTNGAVTATAPSMTITSPSIVINTTVPPADPFANGGVTHFTPKTLTAVVSSSGSEILSASMQTNGSGGLFGSRAASVTFQNTDQLQVTNGDSSNFLNGDALTFWNGNDQSIGIGGLLWANAGITSNLFGGMIINVTNESVGLQGLGENDVKIDHTLTGTTAVTMQVAPLSAALSLTRAKQITFAMNAIMAAGTAAASAWSGDVLKKIHDDTQLIDSADSIANLQTAMTSTNKDLDSLSELIFAVQALSVVLGLILCLTKGKAGDAVSALKLTAVGTSTLSGENVLVSAPEGLIDLNCTSASVRANAFGMIGLSCGLANIIMQPNKVTLSAGAASIVLAPEGITMTGVQVANNALQAGFAPNVVPADALAAAAISDGLAAAATALTVVSDVVE